MSRNIKLDILKILACFSVIVLHVSGIIANTNARYSLNHVLYYLAILAVPIFFMVNGYLLLNKTNITYKYIFRKVTNILIVVFSWNMIIFFLNIITKRSIVNPFSNSIKNLMQDGYFWQFWFFGALLIIYLLLPILYKGFENFNLALLITGLTILTSISIDLISVIRSLNGESIIQVHITQTFRLWTWLSYYLLGGLIGKDDVINYITSIISKRINIILLITSSIVISFYQYYIGHNFYNNTYAEYFYDNIFIYIYIVSLFILICRKDIKVKNYTCINLISGNTMGIYIVHVTIINIFTHFYKFNTSLMNIIFIFIVFIFAFIITYIVSKIPLLRRIVKI